MKTPSTQELDFSRTFLVERPGQRLRLSFVELPHSQRPDFVQVEAGPSTAYFVSSRLQLELCTGSELQETDTAGYWDEFHLKRGQDLRLDLAWRWTQHPGLAWIGSLGATRALDLSAEEAVADPELSFLAFGAHFRW